MTPAPRRFLADRMLARLARWLRMAGEDVTLPARSGTREPSRAVLLRLARTEGRVILTRDRSFPAIAEHGLVLVADTLDDLLAEFYHAFPADPLARAFARCTLCNALVEPTADPAVIVTLPPLVRQRGTAFRRCTACGRVYWEGSHSERIRARLASVARAVDAARSAPAPRTADVAVSGRYDEFLRALLVRLDLEPRAYRRPSRALRQPLAARVAELGLAGFDDYVRYVDAHADEHARLAEILAVTVTRFFRDREDWFHLAAAAFEPLAAAAGRDGRTVRAVSLGCASGEEPYTLRMLWDRAIPLEILALDVRDDLLARARAGLYSASSVHSVLDYLLARHFVREGASWRLDRAIVESVRFERRDVHADPPRGPFDLVLCRNLAFTYLGARTSAALGARLLGMLAPGGFVMVGGNEKLPDVAASALVQLGRCLYRTPSASRGDLLVTTARHDAAP